MIYIDVSGEMAQFRNYFYNSSVISYPFFPRTAIIGFLASILEREHDAYHHEFADAKIALCIKTPLMKEIKTVNFLKTDGFAKNFHSQTNMEYIRSANEQPLTYRIFYSGALEQEVLTSLKNGAGYLRYLGTTECLASIDHFETCEPERIMAPESTYYIDSILPVDVIENLEFDDDQSFFHYEKNRIVYAFENGRKSLGVVDILAETKRGQIKASLKNELTFQVSDVKTVQGELLRSGTKENEIIFVF
jgi:CRISPR-associated protein Cas5 subtype I-B